MDFTLIKKINIKEGEVKKITSSSKIIWEKPTTLIVPITTKNEMPVTKLNIKAGQKITIKYYITKNQGYVYDARRIGLSYYGTVEGTAYPINDADLNKHCTIGPLTAAQDGILTIGANANLVNAGKETIGSLSNYSGDIPVGKYIKIFVE